MFDNGTAGALGGETGIGVAIEPTRSTGPTVKEPEPGTLGAVQNEVMELSSVIAAAQGRLLELLGDEDDVAACASDDGGERWLAWAAGMTPAQARRKLAQAKALSGLPQMAQALKDGAISYEKVLILLPLACPETEADLLAWAKDCAAWDLMKLAQLVSRAMRRKDDSSIRHQIRHYFSSNGYHLRADLSIEDGKIVAAALEGMAKTMLEQESAHHPEPADQREAADLNLLVAHSKPEREADALVALCLRALADPDGGPTWVPGADIVVHVDADTLVNDAPGLAHVDGLGLSTETVRLWGCDGFVQTLIEKDGNPLYLGRKRRLISKRQRRALEGRDLCCRVPGCGATLYTQAHHITDWIKDGKTDIDEVIRLCYRHHRAVHQGRLEIRAIDGVIRFFRAGGSELAEPPRTAIPVGLVATRRRTWAVDPEEWATSVDPGDLWSAADRVLQPLMRAGP